MLKCFGRSTQKTHHKTTTYYHRHHIELGLELPRRCDVIQRLGLSAKAEICFGGDKAKSTLEKVFSCGQILYFNSQPSSRPG